MGLFRFKYRSTEIAASADNSNFGVLSEMVADGSGRDILHEPREVCSGKISTVVIQPAIEVEEVSLTCIARL